MIYHNIVAAVVTAISPIDVTNASHIEAVSQEVVRRVNFPIKPKAINVIPKYIKESPSPLMVSTLASTCTIYINKSHHAKLMLKKLIDRAGNDRQLRADFLHFGVVHEVMHCLHASNGNAFVHRVLKPLKEHKGQSYYLELVADSLALMYLKNLLPRDRYAKLHSEILCLRDSGFFDPEYNFHRELGAIRYLQPTLPLDMGHWFLNSNIKSKTAI